MRLAVVLRRLVGLVKEEAGDDDKASDKGIGGSGNSKAVAETRGRIERFCEKFEQEVLGMFDRWYRYVAPHLGSSVGDEDIG